MDRSLLSFTADFSQAFATFTEFRRLKTSSLDVITVERNLRVWIKFIGGNAALLISNLVYSIKKSLRIVAFSLGSLITFLFSIKAGTEESILPFVSDLAIDHHFFTHNSGLLRSALSFLLN